VTLSPHKSTGKGDEMSLVRRRRAGADLVGSEEIEVLPCVGWRIVCWLTQARRGFLLKRGGSQAKKSTLTLDKTTHKHFWPGRQVSVVTARRVRCRKRWRGFSSRWSSVWSDRRRSLDLAWQTGGSGDGEVVAEQCSDEVWDGDP
jgi:hypothetical protein